MTGGNIFFWTIYKEYFFYVSSPATYFRFGLVLLLVDLNKTIRGPVNSIKSGSTLQIQEQYLGDRENIGSRALVQAVSQYQKFFELAASWHI